MNVGLHGSWKPLGDAVSRRYSQSTWRFLATVLPLLLIPFGLLYLLRGLRAVKMGVFGLVAIGGAALCFSFPFQTLLAALFIAFSGLDVLLPGPMAWSMLGIVVVRVVYDVLDGHHVDWGSGEFRAATCVLTAIALSSLFVAQSVPAASERILDFTLGFLLIASISRFVNSPSRIRLLLLTVVLAFAVNVLGLLITVFRTGGLSLLTELDSSTRFGITDANITAAVACALIPPLVHLTGQSRTRMRLVLCAALFLCVVSVILAVSRLGMILLAISLSLVVLQLRRGRLIAIVGSGFLLLLLTFLPSGYWTRFISLAQFGGIVVDRSLQLRQHALESGWEMFKAHPWLGVGLGNFPLESPRYMSVALMSHNAYLEAAATLGIFGLLAFVAWLVSGLLMGRRAARLWKIAGRPADHNLAVAITSSIVLLCIACMTLDAGFHLFMWLFLSLANAARTSAETGAT